MKFTQAITSRPGSVRKISGTDEWIVDMEFTWWLDYEEKDEVVIVEQGFITDFGSIPRLLWWILNPTEWVSFLLHDNMYQYHIVNNEQGWARLITRKEADTILIEALAVEGCPRWQIILIYLGVRIGGWWGWRH